MKARIILIVAIWILFISILYSSQDELFLTRGEAGSSSAPFLNSQFDAYGVATGGTIVSFGETIESIFWNPAGLCMIKTSQLSLSGAKFSFDRLFSSLSFATPIGENMDKAIGFSLLCSYVGDITSYDENDRRGDDLYYMGNTFIFSYSAPLNMIKLGFNAKVVQELIEKTSAYGGAIDIGILFTPPFPVQLGISVKNSPGIIKWQNDQKVYKLNNSLQVAVSYKSLTGSFKTGVSFLKETGSDDVYVNIGGEISLTSFLDIRYGFLKGKFTGGVGLSLSFAKINYAFYNESFFDVTEGSHLISTVFSF